MTSQTRAERMRQPLASDEIGVAPARAVRETADPIGFMARPLIAARETHEDGRRARVCTLALHGPEELLDVVGVGHGYDSGTRHGKRTHSSFSAPGRWSGKPSH